MRDGQRQPGVMAGIVKTLTDENIRDLGAYYAALPPPPAFAKAEPVDADKVDAIMGPRRCGNCHKEDFSGQGETGRLAGQRPDYLIKSLKDFRAGVRRGRGMGAMMEVSVTLQDEDIVLISTIWRPSLDTFFESPTSSPPTSKETSHGLENTAYRRDRRRHGNQLLRFCRPVVAASAAADSPRRSP